MTPLGATQVLALPRVPLAADDIESLRARCTAAETAATTAEAAASAARAELLQMRQTCQQMLEASALEVLELKRELQARSRVAMDRAADSSRSPEMHPASADTAEDEIPFDRIEAVLAASPL